MGTRHTSPTKPDTATSITFHHAQDGDGECGAVVDVVDDVVVIVVVVVVVGVVEGVVVVVGVVEGVVDAAVQILIHARSNMTYTHFCVHDGAFRRIVTKNPQQTNIHTHHSVKLGLEYRVLTLADESDTSHKHVWLAASQNSRITKC
tara:strand:+ start:8240 stop:8680 length:441 start_codon:yes stop_codon:yes gene_type:complete